MAISTKSSYWLCVALLGFCLLCELALMAQLPVPLQPVAFGRVAALAAIIVGVVLLSNTARYVGAVFLGASSLYTIYSVSTAAKFVVSSPLLATIVLATGLELIAAYFLALSGTFSREFGERRALAPAAVTRARLSVLILLAICVIVLTAIDIYRLVYRQLKLRSCQRALPGAFGRSGRWEGRSTCGLLLLRSYSESLAGVSPVF